MNPKDLEEAGIKFDQDPKAWIESHGDDVRRHLIHGVFAHYSAEYLPHVVFVVMDTVLAMWFAHHEAVAQTAPVAMQPEVLEYARSAITSIANAHYAMSVEELAGKPAGVVLQ